MLLRLISAWFLGICLTGAALLPQDLPLGKPYKPTGHMVAMKDRAALYDLGKRSVLGFDLNTHAIIVDGSLRGVYVTVPPAIIKAVVAKLVEAYGVPVQQGDGQPLVAVWQDDDTAVGLFWDGEVFRLAFLAPAG